MLAGATILQCVVDIENLAIPFGDGHWVVMDGVLVTKQAHDNEVRGRFNYFREDVSEIVRTGRNLVTATVCLFHETPFI